MTSDKLVNKIPSYQCVEMPLIQRTFNFESPFTLTFDLNVRGFLEKFSGKLIVRGLFTRYQRNFSGLNLTQFQIFR